VRLTHVRLLVDDFGRCFGFYRDVLGLEPSFGDERGPHASFATEPAGAVDLRARGPAGD
jgi:catechol 2,3-dioxygenase-like lactoylglutathione lyase family enzyme